MSEARFGVAFQRPRCNATEQALASARLEAAGQRRRHVLNHLAADGAVQRKPLGFRKPRALDDQGPRQARRVRDLLRHGRYVVLAGGGGLNSNVTDLMTYLDANIGEPAPRWSTP